MSGKKIGLFVLGLIASLYLAGCGGSSAPISVAVSATTSTVDGADTTTITATVTNDQGAKGVSWTISGAGTLSNSTTTSTTFTANAATSTAQTATITATSIANTAETAAITVTIAAKPAVTSSGTPPAVGVGGSGTAYTLTVSGGVSPYTWALTSGNLPPCLTLNTSTGVISGTITASCVGTFTPTFTVTDSGSPTKYTATLQVNFTINPATAITFTPSLPAAAVGTAYSGSAAASGGAGSLTYAVASGNLPPDLSLNPATGAITGTPKAADVGTANFTISAMDAFGDTASSGNLSIVVTGPTITFPASLAPATVGTAYSASAAATGALGTSTYSIVSGSLPASGNLVFNTSTGAITGTPHAADVGTSTIKVKVVDAYGDTATSGNLNIVISAPTITFPTSLPGATVGYAYSASVAATGVAGASTYSIVSGSLPASGNLVLNTSTGAITGTPHAADEGTSTFQVKVVDAFGDTVTSGSLSIVIAAPGPITLAPTLSNPTATAGTAYSGSVAAGTPGGVTPLTYAITAGSLPTGLQFNTSTGAITGTTTAAGTYNFTVQLSDNFGDTPASQGYTLTVQSAAASKLAISPGTLTPTVGSAFYVFVTLEDQYGNTVTSGTDTIQLTASGPASFTPVSKALVNGLASFQVNLTTAGSWTFTSSDTTTPSVTSATTSTVTFEPAAASMLAISPATTTPTAGTAFNVTVTVEDQYGNTVTSSSDNVQLTTTDASSNLPLSLAVSSGIKIFSVTLNTAGAATITASDLSGGGVTSATTGTLTVGAGSASKLVFTNAPSSSLTAGTPFGATVQVEDANGNVVTSSNASVTISSTVTGVSGTTTVNAVNGVATFTGLTLDISGSYTLTAASAGLASATTGSFTIKPGAATTLAILAPASVTTNVPFNVTVTAQDGYGNLVTNNTGSTDTVKLTGAGPSSATYGPTSQNLASGTTTFSVTLGTNGTWSLTASDSTSPGSVASATSNNINVSSALIITTSVLNPLDAGQAATQVLSASGGSGNSANYTWSITVGSLPTGITLVPATGALTGSTTVTGTFPVTVKVADSGTSTSTTANLSLTIYGALSLPAANSLPAAYTNVPYTGGIAGSGGSGLPNVSLSITSALAPSNGTLSANVNGETLNFTGTPTAVQATESIMVKLTDALTSNSISQTYTFSVSNSTYTLPTSNPPAATDNQSYTGATINATVTGGSGNYVWLINGVEIPTNGTSAPLGASGLAAQFSASNNGGTTLNLSGSPTSTGSFQFTAAIYDNTTGQQSSTQTYTITVNPNGSTVSGTITLYNTCNFTLPNGYFTVTLTNTGTSTVYGTTTTDGSGNYSFSGVPDGTYSITPSLTGSPTGSSSLYYATDSGLTSSNGVYTSVALNSAGSTVSGANFNAEVGFTVTGNLIYGGAQKGWTFLTLSNNNCGGQGGPGTSVDITAPTSGTLYTIRGVSPGTYTLSAWMDPIGEGVTNAIDPTGTANSTVMVSDSSTTQNITINDPTFATPYENPSISTIIPNAEGALIVYSPSQQSGNGEEDANEYVVEWSTSPQLNGGSGSGSQQFVTVTGSHTFPASGDNTDLWNLTSAVFQAGLSNGTSTGAFSPGATYYFQFRSYNTLDTANPHPSGAWCNYLTGSNNNCGGTSGNFTAVTLSAPSTSGLTQVNGTVTIPSGVTIKSGATFYVGLVEFGSSGTSGGPQGIYVSQYTGTLSTGTALPFTAYAPAGSNYGVVAFLDENNIGLINGPGIVGDANDTLVDNITVGSASPQTLTSTQDLTLPSTGSSATVGTQYYSSTQYCNGCNGGNGPSTTTGYQLVFDVEPLYKLPVAVTVTGASNLNVLNNAGTVALDMTGCSQCGQNQFEYQVPIIGGKPNVGDTYTFTVTYSDSTPGAPDTQQITGTVTAFGSTGAIVGPNDLPTNMSPGPSTTGVGSQPNFTWTWPAAGLTSNSYYYQFSLSPTSGCSGNCDIWDIPGNNSKTNGFTYTQDLVPSSSGGGGGTSSLGQITWGVDPSGSGTSPSSSLTTSPATSYNWQIQVQDNSNGNGNQAQTSTYFTTQ